jgi:dTDP-4-dehydrorhamnose 3,5-epimerase
VKILNIRELKLPAVKVITFARFRDHRGYFAEHFRRSDFRGEAVAAFLPEPEFVQANESFSKAGTIRGLHFQWSPLTGKLVRTVYGHMIDMVLDIRIGSPDFGRIIAHNMPSNRNEDTAEWIWVPPGFAHGNIFSEDTVIEYFCTGEHNPDCEGVIAPLASDLDWSFCDPDLKDTFDSISAQTELMTEKDKTGLSVAAWKKDPRSANLIYY